MIFVYIKIPRYLGDNFLKKIEILKEFEKNYLKKLIVRFYQFSKKKQNKTTKTTTTISIFFFLTLFIFILVVFSLFDCCYIVKIYLIFGYVLENFDNDFFF